MSRGQMRDAQGRFANPFYQFCDAILRSGADLHGRLYLDDAEPLSRMAAEEAGTAGDNYLYAVAVRAVVRWFRDERPTRHVEVEYVDPSREHIVTRDVRGRLGCTDGNVHVSSIEWGAVPRRIAVAPDEQDALDADADERAAYGDALRAHEGVR